VLFFDRSSALSLDERDHSPDAILSLREADPRHRRNAGPLTTTSRRVSRSQYVLESRWLLATDRPRMAPLSSALGAKRDQTEAPWRTPMNRTFVCLLALGAIAPGIAVACGRGDAGGELAGRAAVPAPLKLRTEDTTSSCRSSSFGASRQKRAKDDDHRHARRTW
jgi:hypothetical protein